LISEVSGGFFQYWRNFPPTIFWNYLYREKGRL
jgi:hypothetical protein